MEFICILSGGKAITVTLPILCMRPANEKRRYDVTPSVIGRAHAQMIPEGMLINREH